MRNTPRFNEVAGSDTRIPAIVVNAEGLSVTPESHDVSFVKKIRAIIEETGMPTAGLTSIVYRQSSDDEKQSGWRTLGAMVVSGKNKGRLTVTDAVTNPNILLGMGATIYHELAHSLNPFDYGNAVNRNMYKSEEGARKVAEYVYQLAQQTKKTEIYLNNYHKKIFEEAAQMRAEGNNNRAEEHILLETHAIVMEMLATRPADLQAKSIAQEKAMKDMKLESVSAYKVGLNCFKELVGYGSTKGEIELQLNKNKQRIDLILHDAVSSVTMSPSIQVSRDRIMATIPHYSWIFDPVANKWVKRATNMQ